MVILSIQWNNTKPYKKYEERPDPKGWLPKYPGVMGLQLIFKWFHEINIHHTYK